MTADLVALNLDGNIQSVPGDLWRLWLRSEKFESPPYVQVGSSAHLDWAQLDRLENLVELHYSGTDGSVVEYLARHPKIQRFYWHDHEQTSIDISSLSVEEFGVECFPGLASLRLPRCARFGTLNLHDLHRSVPLQVDAVDRGAGLTLWIWFFEGMTPPPVVVGLENISKLFLVGCGEIDVAVLVRYESLNTLVVRNPKIGVVRGLAQLAAFEDLQRLELNDCYVADWEAIPALSQLPSLEEVQIDGIERSHAGLLTKRLEGVSKLSIRGKKSPQWIQDNPENPFRKWPEEYGSRVGNGALRAYRKASKEWASSALSQSDARDAVWALVDELNALHVKSPFDTTMREEAIDACVELVRRLAVELDGDCAAEWAEQRREF